MSIIKSFRASSYEVTIKRVGIKTVEETYWVKKSEDADGKPVMGYSPPRLEELESSDVIFQQTVTSLDLTAVVCAVNTILLPLIEQTEPLHGK
jgi:hypothetical protein